MCNIADTMVNSSTKTNHSPATPHSISITGSESVHDFMNLREWLAPGFRKISNLERLQIFKRIVESVDLAHSQGFVMLDLRPSCFIY